MKKFILPILLFIILMPFFVSAKEFQLLDELNTKIFAFDVEKDSNNNYIVVGSYYSNNQSHIKKFDENKNLLFSKTFENIHKCYSITVDKDDNIYLLCENIDVIFNDEKNNVTSRAWNTIIHNHLIKLDSDGNIIFDKDLDKTKDYSHLNGIQIEDNYLYLIGDYYNYQDYLRTEGKYNYYKYTGSRLIIKFNLLGNEVNRSILGNDSKIEEKKYVNDTSSTGGRATATYQEKDHTFLFDEDNIYVYGSINGGIFLESFSEDFSKNGNNRFGSKSRLVDNTKANNGNYITVGAVDLNEMDTSQSSKIVPIIIEYDSNANLISYKLIDGKGEFVAIKNKDNGYYGIIELSEVNISGYNNDATGYFLVKYDNNFAVENMIKLEKRGVNLFDFNDSGISVLDSDGIIRHYIMKNNYKVNVVNKNDSGKLQLVEDRKYFYNEEVKFDISLEKGYKIKEIQVKDSNGNIISLTDEKSFIMPDNDVTITPIYEKVKSSVNVEIMNETDDITVSIDDMSQVEYEEEVNFKVTPIKGYKVSDVKVVDTDGNEIEYNTTDKKNYTFTMPASDVTIIPSYERVSNSVSVDDNKNTKEFIIEVNDSKTVVYEDTVKFTITPEDGYTIDTIIIKDSNDNEITFKKTSNKSEYSFVMPDSDVVITPTYRKLESINVPDTVKNPNTGTGISIIIIFMLIISSITYIIFKRKKNYIMK